MAHTVMALPVMQLAMIPTIWWRSTDNWWSEGKNNYMYNKNNCIRLGRHMHAHITWLFQNDINIIDYYEQLFHEDGRDV